MRGANAHSRMDVDVDVDEGSGIRALRGASRAMRLIRSDGARLRLERVLAKIFLR